MSRPTRQENLGLWLDVLGVTIFAMTVPMTRLATGTAALAQLSPWFVSFGRAVLAAMLSALFLLLTRSPLALPVTLPGALLTLPAHNVTWSAWK